MSAPDEQPSDTLGPLVAELLGGELTAAQRRLLDAMYELNPDGSWAHTARY